MSSSSKPRKKYLQLTPLEDSLTEYLQKFTMLYPVQEEMVDVWKALNRVTSRPIHARISSPFYRASAMDGYAVRSAQTSEANESSPVKLQKGKDAIPVDTGDPIPPGYDAVIMIEDVHETRGNSIEITRSAPQGQHIKKAGEDINASEMLFPSGHRLRPQDIGCILAGGLTQIPVRRRPTVAIIPTGSEVRSPISLDIKNLRPGDIIDSSSSMLRAFLEALGVSVRITSIIPDNESLLEAEIKREIQESDMVLVIAGSSSGSEDYTATVISLLGTIYSHGLAIAPGKPTILSSIDEKPCIGMPGYPVSTLIVAEYLIRPLIHQMLGLPLPSPVKRKAILSEALPSRLGIEEFIRVGLGRIGNSLLAVPLPRQASALSSYIRADGIVRIPRLSEGIPEETEIEVELIIPEDRIEKTLIHQGSHDLCLDILQNILWSEYGIRLSSFNIGSLAGLYALKKGLAHCAGCHFFDTRTGSYSTRVINEFFPDASIKIVHLAYQEQGLFIAKGNPLNIKGIKDLSDNNLRFINRQKGSVTRALLDHLLRESGISPEKIKGYTREEYSHHSVAAQIAIGSADAGFGPRASAQAMDLDFIPLSRDEYDLIIPEVRYSDEVIQYLLAVIKTEGFRSRARNLGGYDPSRSGEIHKMHP